LTPSHKLRSAPFTRLLRAVFVEEDTGPVPRGRFAAAFSAAVEADDQTSDAPCRSPRPPGQSRAVKRRARTASTALASTRTAFPARSAFHRHVLHPHSQAAPATDLAALPLRSGFRRSFASPMLSHAKARSSTVTRAIHPGSRGPRAACRLLQSITIDEHNRLIDRTPHTARGVAPRRSSNRPPSVGLSRLLSSCGTGWPSSCSKLSQPRCHRSGARQKCNSMPAPFTTIARD
jgi:hypothetical protein